MTVKLTAPTVSDPRAQLNFEQIARLISEPVAVTPVNTSLPTISGGTIVGETLTASTGGWDNSPESWTYDWQRNGTHIAGSSVTDNHYTLVSADLGATITVAVTAQNASGVSASATSPAVGPVVQAVSTPQVVSLPAITGTATEDDTLTLSDGSWTNSPTGYTYQWNRGGVAISGATSSTYTLVSADVGFTITGTVIAANGSGNSDPATSVAVGPVAAAGDPVNNTLPVISGQAVEGVALSVTDGTWTADPPITSTTYQWYRLAGGSTPSVVQSEVAENGSSTPQSKAFASVTAGNRILVFAEVKSAAGSPDAVSVSDTMGLTYTRSANDVTGFVGTLNLAVFLSDAIASTGANTVSAAYTTGGSIDSTSAAFLAVEVANVSGVDVVEPAHNDSGTAPTVSGTPTQAGDLAVAFAACSTVPTSTPGVVDPTWTDETGPQTFASDINPWSWQVVPGTAPVTANWQQASGHWAALLALLKASGGAGSTAISGATSSTYTPVLADVGAQLTCYVTATNSAGSTTAVAAATVAVIASGGNPPMSQYTDPLTSLDSSLTTVSGSPTASGGTLTLPCTSSGTMVALTDPRDLTGSSFFSVVQPPAVGSGGRYTFLQLDQGATGSSGYYVEIGVIGSPRELRAYIAEGGSATLVASATYDAAAMVLFRIRETGGLIYFEYSADGASWTPLGSTSYTMDITALYPNWHSQYSGTESASSATVLYVNVQPPLSGGGTGNSGGGTGGSSYTPPGPYQTQAWWDDFTGNALSSDWHASDSASGDPDGGYSAFGVGWSKNNVAVGPVTLGGQSYSCVTLTASSSSLMGNIATIDKGFWEPGATALKSWDHGTFVARMWMPPGTGMWPAFWLLNTNDLKLSGTGAEIDIVEMVMGPNSSVSSFWDNNSKNVWQTVHLPGSQNANSQGYLLSAGADTGWNTFACSFDAASGIVTYYVNEVQTHRLTGFTWPPAGNNQWFILLTLAAHSPSTTYPQHLYVDWVRVFQ